MRAHVVRIGNSRGIRIPKAMLEQCRLDGPVELEVERGRLIVRSPARPREGWEEAFREMAERGDDALLDAGSLTPTKWERDEWTW